MNNSLLFCISAQEITLVSAEIYFQTKQAGRNALMSVAPRLGHNQISGFIFDTLNKQLQQQREEE